MEHPTAELRRAIGDCDRASFIFKGLAQKIIDYGGDMETVRRLCGPSHVAEALFSAMAKKAVGRIWDIADNEIDLGKVDTRESFSKSLVRARATVHTEGLETMTERAPLRRCKYRLMHLRGLYGDELHDRVNKMQRDHAGVRELLALHQHIPNSTLKGFKVWAFGSSTRESNYVNNPEVFPIAFVDDEDERGLTSGPERSGLQKHLPNEFCLTRVYN